MRTIAKLLTVLAVLALLLLGYVVYTSKLIVNFDSMSVTSCADQPETFSACREMAQKGASEITMLGDLPGYDPLEYQFVTYTVDVRNLNLLSAEWMDLTLTGEPGDVMQINPRAQDLAAFNSGKISVMLMTSRSVTNLTRRAVLSYYVYGRPYQVDLILS